MLLELVLSLLNSGLRQEDALELMVLQHHRDGMLQQLDALEEVVDVQSLVDDPVDLALSLGDLPVLRVESECGQSLVEALLEVLEVSPLGLFGLEVFVGEGGFEEVHSEELEEEEGCEEGREDASDVGGHVDEFEVASIDSSGEG